jgi:hypothetical protein
MTIKQFLKMANKCPEDAEIIISYSKPFKINRCKRKIIGVSKDPCKNNLIHVFVGAEQEDI